MRQATDLLAEAATAARAMDTSRLADLVREMGQVSNTLSVRATACRDVAPSGGGAVTSVPSAVGGG